FYSFNAPPPPAPSPLSLHDAFRSRAGRFLPAAGHALQCLAEHRHGEQQLRVLVMEDVHLAADLLDLVDVIARPFQLRLDQRAALDRKSTRLNSSHRTISYAVFCLK